MKKITIIGMGFLMEYIFPCIRALADEDISQQVNAVTADAADLEGKQKRLGIPVLLNDNLKALHTLEPNWIFFAPPPTIAPGLVETCLKPYYAECCAAGRPLPVLFAFPPKPAGAYYQEQLGSDLRAAAQSTAGARRRTSRRRCRCCARASCATPPVSILTWMVVSISPGCKEAGSVERSSVSVGQRRIPP